MKRFLCFLLALSLLMSVAACGKEESEPAETAGGQNQTVPETTAPGEEETAAPTEATSPAFVRTDLVNDENLVFAVTEFTGNDHLGLQMQVYCENKTDRNLMFSLDGVSVCGIMYDPFWAEEVAAGKGVYSTVSFDTYALEELGVLSVDEISFRLSVIDSEEWMNEPLADDHFTVYPTGLSADTVVYPEYVHKNGETIIMDDENLLFIVEKVNDAGDDLYTLNCYIVNRTDKDLLLSWDNVSVNGMMVDPFWAAAVGAGKQLYTTVSFFRSDLEPQGIEDVQEIVFTLTGFDYDDFSGDYLLEETFTFQPK